MITKSLMYQFPSQSSIVIRGQSSRAGCCRAVTAGPPHGSWAHGSSRGYPRSRIEDTPPLVCPVPAAGCRRDGCTTDVPPRPVAHVSRRCSCALCRAQSRASCAAGASRSLSKSRQKTSGPRPLRRSEARTCSSIDGIRARHRHGDRSPGLVATSPGPLADPTDRHGAHTFSSCGAALRRRTTITSPPA